MKWDQTQYFELEWALCTSMYHKRHVNRWFPNRLDLITTESPQKIVLMKCAPRSQFIFSSGSVPPGPFGRSCHCDLHVFKTIKRLSKGLWLNLWSREVLYLRNYFFCLVYAVTRILSRVLHASRILSSFIINMAKQFHKSICLIKCERLFRRCETNGILREVRPINGGGGSLAYESRDSQISHFGTLWKLFQ